MTKTQQVGRPRQRRGGQEIGKPGQLDRFEDGSWEFSGNDETTPQDVAEQIIRYEQEQGQAEYQALKADALAQLLLEDASNRALKERIASNVRKAVPRKSVFVANAPTLKQCVALLVKHEGALRQALKQQDVAGGADKTLGTVRSAGLSLPLDD